MTKTKEDLDAVVDGVKHANLRLTAIAELMREADEDDMAEIVTVNCRALDKAIAALTALSEERLSKDDILIIYGALTDRVKRCDEIGAPMNEKGLSLVNRFYDKSRQALKGGE